MRGALGVVQVQTEGGLVKSSKRIGALAVLGLSCLFALSILAPNATALADKTKVAAVKENTHFLEVAVQSYAVDNNDLFPRYTTGKEFRALLRPLLFTGHWPVNPYTGRPIRMKRSAGNFTYATYANQSSFRLIGWGRHGRRIIVRSCKPSGQ